MPHRGYRPQPAQTDQSPGERAQSRASPDRETGSAAGILNGDKQETLHQLRHVLPVNVAVAPSGLRPCSMLKYTSHACLQRGQCAFRMVL